MPLIQLTLELLALLVELVELVMLVAPLLVELVASLRQLQRVQRMVVRILGPPRYGSTVGAAEWVLRILHCTVDLPMFRALTSLEHALEPALALVLALVIVPVPALAALLLLLLVVQALLV